MTDLETHLRDALADAGDAVPVPASAWADYRQIAPARRRQGRRRVGLAVAAVGVSTAGIVIGAALVGGTSQHPGSSDPLLQGSVETVQLTPARTLTSDQLQQSVTILRERLKALHVDGAEVATMDGAIVVTLPKRSIGTLASVAGTPGLLRFRQVLEAESSQPPTHSQPRPLQRAGRPESAALTPRFRSTFNRWDCKKQPNPTHGRDTATNYTIGCDTAASAKYLLAPAALSGAALSSASEDRTSGSQSVVDLTFTRSGSAAWLQLTKRTFEATNSPDSGFSTNCQPPTGCNAIALVLDGVVLSAPATQQDGIPGGASAISGSFSHDQAATLAAALKTEPLPTAFRIVR